MLPKNENVAEEMVNILEALTECVPEVQVKSNMEQQAQQEVDGADTEEQRRGEVIPFPVPLAGDMLMAASARTTQDIRVTSSSNHQCHWTCEQSRRLLGAYCSLPHSCSCYAFFQYGQY